jgi:hypothetical protein
LIEGLTGDTEMDCKVADLTVNVSLELTTPLSVAVICELPADTPVARPGLHNGSYAGIRRRPSDTPMFLEVPSL